MSNKKFTLFSILVFGVWLGLPTLVIWKSANLTAAGQIGDTFGLVNSLFSALALLGAVATLYLQSRQLQQAMSDVTQQLIVSTASSQLSALPELIREQRSLLLSLDGSLTSVDLNLVEIERELHTRQQGKRPTMNEEQAKKIIETLEHLRSLLVHQAELFSELRKMTTGLTSELKTIK